MAYALNAMCPYLYRGFLAMENLSFKEVLQSTTGPQMNCKYK